MGLDKDEARRRLQQGAKDPKYRRTQEYRDANQFALGHYRGILRGEERRQAMEGKGKSAKGKRGAHAAGGGASQKGGCGLTALILLMAFVGAPALAVYLTASRLY